MIVLGKEIQNIENNSNVLVMGCLIMKKDFGKYIDLVIDDFTNIITVRVFDLNIEHIEEGDFVIVYGYIKEYQGYKKVYAKEVIKSKESDVFYWLYKVMKEKEHKINKDESKLIKEVNEEVEEENGESEDNVEIEIEKIEFDFDPKEYVLEIIRNSPNKEISLEELYKKANKLTKEEIDKVLEEIADEIFEPKPGIIKLIEI